MNRRMPPRRTPRALDRCADRIAVATVGGRVPHYTVRG
jgi:hypothetical protein